MKKIIDNHCKILNSDYYNYHYHIIYDFKIKYISIINFIYELIDMKYFN